MTEAKTAMTGAKAGAVWVLARRVLARRCAGAALAAVLLGLLIGPGAQAQEIEIIRLSPPSSIDGGPDDGAQDPAEAQDPAAAQDPDAATDPEQGATEEVAAAPEPEEPEPLVRDPVAAAKQDIERFCLIVDYPDSFARFEDLTGDGLDDVIISYAVTCDNYHSMFCDMQGCQGRVYVALEAGLYKLTNLPPRVEATEWNGVAAVRVYAENSACRRSRSDRCARVQVWDGEQFADARTARVTQSRAQTSVARAPTNPGPPAGPAPPLSRFEWRFLASPGGGVIGVGGGNGAALLFDCQRGDDTLRLRVRPTREGAALLAPQDNARLLVEFVIGRSWRIESRLLTYQASDGVWWDRVIADGSLVEGLRLGSVVRLREPGRQQPLAEFSLSRSSSALGTLVAVCRL